jgi:hypothetical protein
LVQASEVEQARWLRDLLRFLPLRSQFVLSGNTRDLQIHEAAPGQLTSVSLSRALPHALKAAGYGRIASFDLLNGFRGVEPADDSFLVQLGLTVANGAAAGGVDLLAATLERHVAADGPHHLRHLLLCYMKYYNGARTHLSLEKDAPVSRAVDRAGHICRQILGGLHHQYARI